MIRCLYAFWLSLFLIAVPVAADEEHNHDKAPVVASTPPPLFKDLGTLHHPITTSSPQAQQYFDQGLRLIYAFNHDEATRSFTEAARLDPNCAMAYWGIAHAVGPNYNLALDPEREKTATEAIQKALSLAAKVSDAERAYIEALAKRFPNPPSGDRKALDTAYADAMRKVARRYPDDLDAATLFAESLMVLRPWDLWTLDGQPHPGTPEIISTLEVVLQKDPNHPGAMHYYIHAVEPSPSPERAVPYAERLAQLTPGAGHLVHMPSHIFIRVGRYREAVDSNAQAMKVDENYIAKYNVQGIYSMMYYPHNIHFLWAAASMEGSRAEALRAARSLVAKVPPEMIRQMPPAEYFAPTVLFALARFGEWKTILKEPAPPAEFQYTTGVWHYVRGLAFVATNRLEDAANEQVRVKDLAAALPADQIIGDNTPAAVLLHIAAPVNSLY